MVSSKHFRVAGLSALTAFLVGFAVLTAAPARAEDPIKIGFGMALSGALAGAGKSALLSMEIWREDINAKGGLLGRPVEFVYYDDQTNPSTVPGIYTKLINLDRVDLVVSGYGSVTIAPAMPIVIKGLSWLDTESVNGFSKFHVHMSPITSDRTLESPCGCHFVFYLIESDFAGFSPNHYRIPSALIPIQRR